MAGTMRVNDRKNIAWYYKLLVIMGVVFGTWNPSEYNFINVIKHMDYTNAFNYFIVLIVLVIWLIFAKVVYEAMGKVGTVIFLILATFFIIGMYQNEWISFDDMATSGLIINSTIVSLVFIATMVPVWWRRLTGKVSTDSDFE